MSGRKKAARLGLSTDPDCSLTGSAIVVDSLEQHREVLGPRTCGILFR
nr:MAG TPA: hypothetical protein [Caudoviricetes sp.]